MELRSLFGQLVPRLQSLELAGDPQTAKTTFVGGHKTVPIRYSLQPREDITIGQAGDPLAAPRR
jgi:hypothetical protein